MERSNGSASADAPAVTAVFVPGSSRRAFLQRSATAAMAAGAAAVLVSAGTRPVRAAEGKGGKADEFMSIQKHENDHVDFLVGALGNLARPKPTFKNLLQKSYKDFVDVSQALENTGVGAYLGAAPVIADSDYLAAAGSIALIEARHAGFLNYLQGSPLTANILDLSTGNSFEEPLTAAQVRNAAGPFFKSLNGGPPVDYSNVPSEANDIAILNFALALEYLEAEFYNVNVPRFFK